MFLSELCVFKIERKRERVSSALTVFALLRWYPKVTLETRVSNLCQCIYLKTDIDT